MILPPFLGHVRHSTQHHFLDGGHGTMLQSWNVGPVMAELSRSGGELGTVHPHWGGSR